MSLKRMVTKLALAFAAKKGMEAFRNAGGIDGVKQMLAGNTSPGSAAAMGQRSATTQGHGRVGGTLASDTGGLGSLLNTLGYGGATGGREAGVTGQVAAGNPSLGNLFGSLAAAIGGQQQPVQDRHAMEDQLSDDTIKSSRDAKSVLRAMVHMARADGGIQDDEYAALMDLLEDASDEEREVLRASMQEPVDAERVAADTPMHARKAVYSAALLIGEPDKPAEKTFLRNLASHLHLNTADVNRLHAAMGKPAV